MADGFKIDGHLIPNSYDTNSDKKLQVSELNIWCKENDFKYDKQSKKIIPAKSDWHKEYVLESKIDKTKYSLESLKKRYPDSKYSIEQMGPIIKIIDKSNGEKVLWIFEEENPNALYIYQGNIDSLYIRKYDKNGNLEYYFKDKEEHYPFADNIHAAVSAKKAKIIPTTDINKLVLNINRITPENIIELEDYYQKEYGESILEAIQNEYGLDDTIKNKLIQHLNQCAYEAQKEKINCKIDRDFSQGNIGDCWFLASIAAIQRSPKGQEILDNMIKDNRDGTYTVKFKGTKEEYTVGASELTSNPDWASGDLDIRILEIAAQKYYSCIGAPIESGGNPYAALELLLGTGDQWQNLARCYASKPEPQKIKELLDNKNIVMTASISPFSKLWGLIVKEIPDNADYKNDIATAHAYAVVDVDNNNIYLKNPWDTGKTIAIPFDIFKEYWGIVQYTEIK